MTKILENNYVQIAIWATAGLGAALTCPTVFTISFIAGGVFTAIDETFRYKTGQSLSSRMFKEFEKLGAGLPENYLKKTILFVKYSLALSMISTLVSYKLDDQDPQFNKFVNVVIPYIYGVATYAFASPFFAALSGLKTASLIGCEVIYIKDILINKIYA